MSVSSVSLPLRFFYLRFMEEAPTFAKYLIDNFGEFQFYMGKSMNPEAAMAFGYYKEGATAPTFVYIKAGLKVLKVKKKLTNKRGEREVRVMIRERMREKEKKNESYNRVK